MQDQGLSEQQSLEALSLSLHGLVQERIAQDPRNQKKIEIHFLFNPFANPEDQGSWKRDFTPEQIIQKYIHETEKISAEFKKQKIEVDIRFKLSINRQRHAEELPDLINKLNTIFKSQKWGRKLQGIDINGAESVLDYRQELNLFKALREIKENHRNLELCVHLGDPNHIKPSALADQDLDIVHSGQGNHIALAVFEQTKRWIRSGLFNTMTHGGILLNPELNKRQINELLELIKKHNITLELAPGYYTIPSNGLTMPHFPLAETKLNNIYEVLRAIKKLGIKVRRVTDSVLGHLTKGYNNQVSDPSHTVLIPAGSRRLLTGLAA